MFFLKSVNKETELKYKLKQYSMCDIKFKDGYAWMNPHEQHIFNYGHFTVEDFEDLIYRHTGKIVKGETEEEKRLNYNLYLFFKENEHTNMFYWDYKYFHLVEYYNSGAGFDRDAKNLIKIKKDNHDEVIKKTYGLFFNEIVSDFGYRKYDDVYREYQNTFWGCTKTLVSMGIGFIGACNTPCEIQNLSWYRDLVILKAYYTHLNNKGKCTAFNEWLKYQNDKKDLEQIGLL